MNTANVNVTIDAFDAWQLTASDALAATDRGEPLSPEEQTVWSASVEAMVLDALDDCDGDTDRALVMLARRALAAELRTATV